MNSQFFPTKIDERGNVVEWNSILNQKTDLILLSILFLDKLFIFDTIEILKMYLEKLNLENVIVCKKCIMFKRDFLTGRNITQIIY